MPTERFTDEMLKQFEVTPTERPKEKPRWKDGSRGWYLTPNRTHERSRVFECTPEEWTTILRLSKAGGLHLYDGDPITTDKVRQLTRAINTAIQKNPLGDPEMKDWVERFLSFLEGDGAWGFALSREWRRLSGR